ELKQNYPNPFNPSTTIEFTIMKSSDISLRIYDIKGELVEELLDYERFAPGDYYVDYQSSKSLSSGVYLYQMTAWTENRKEIFIDAKKMIILK
ncbi:MAG: T9SS C-terminal target domain-containing protein, partial [Ignavibacteriae bacterium]